MKTLPSAARRRYLRFAAAATGVAGLLVLVGWLPTARLAGPGGWAAMLAGCGIGLAGSLLGGLPVALGERRDEAGTNRGTPPVVRALAAMGLRFGTVVALAAAAGLSGLFSLRPLLLWTAIGYLGLLIVDSRYAVAAARVAESVDGDGIDGTELGGRP
jgi:hypothetical protein